MIKNNSAATIYCISTDTTAKIQNAEALAEITVVAAVERFGGQRFRRNPASISVAPGRWRKNWSLFFEPSPSSGLETTQRTQTLLVDTSVPRTDGERRQLAS